MVQTILLYIDSECLSIAGYMVSTPDVPGVYFTRSHDHAATVVYDTSGTFVTELIQCGVDVDIARNFVRFAQSTEARVKAVIRSSEI